MYIYVHKIFQRRSAMGNMMQEHIFLDIWTNNIMTKFRKNLLNGERKDNPCSSCNDGTIFTKNHAKKWREVYKFN